MVANFRMRLIHATVDVSVENESRSNPGSDRHVDQAALVLAGAPACLSKSCGIGIVPQTRM